MGDWPASHLGPGWVTADDSNGDVPTITASASANTKGSWTALIASTSADAAGIIVTWTGLAANVSYLIDLGVGGSGSEQVIVADMHWSANARAQHYLWVPCDVPAGSRVAARCASSASASTVRLRCNLVHGGLLWGPHHGTIRTYGADATDSGGTACQSDTGTYGAWAQLSASTVDDIRAMVVTTGGQNNTSPTAGTMQLQIGVGGSGSEQVVLDGIVFFPNALNDAYGPPPPFWLPVPVIPAGSRLAVRARANFTDATDRLFDVVVHTI